MGNKKTPLVTIKTNTKNTCITHTINYYPNYHKQKYGSNAYTGPDNILKVYSHKTLTIHEGDVTNMIHT